MYTPTHTHIYIYIQYIHTHLRPNVCVCRYIYTYTLYDPVSRPPTPRDTPLLWTLLCILRGIGAFWPIYPCHAHTNSILPTYCLFTTYMQSSSSTNTACWLPTAAIPYNFGTDNIYIIFHSHSQSLLLSSTTHLPYIHTSPLYTILHYLMPIHYLYTVCVLSTCFEFTSYILSYTLYILWFTTTSVPVHDNVFLYTLYIYTCIPLSWRAHPTNPHGEEIKYHYMYTPGPVDP